MKKPQQIEQRVYIRPLWKHAVPTNEEVRLMLDLIPDYHPLKVAIGILATMGLRPIEVCKLKWHWWKRDEQGNFIGLEHLIHKPKNTINQYSTSQFYKAIRKPVMSEWLNKQLLGYEKSGIKCMDNRMFPFSTTDSMHKWFTNTRKKLKQGKMGEEYGFFLDTTLQPLTNASQTQYRVSLYSLRRFCLTFLFHNPLYFKGDVLKLAKTYSGHSNIKTLLDHYLQPKEAIRYDGSRITIDQFIQLRAKNQVKLDDFLPNPESVKKLDPQQQVLCY